MRSKGLKGLKWLGNFVWTIIKAMLKSLLIAFILPFVGMLLFAFFSSPPFFGIPHVVSLMFIIFFIIMFIDFKNWVKTKKGKLGKDEEGETGESGRSHHLTQRKGGRVTAS